LSFRTPLDFLTDALALLCQAKAEARGSAPLRVCAERRKIADKKREEEIEAENKSTEEEQDGQI
jgi:hypothetical protein